MNCIILHGCPSPGEKAMDPNARTYDKHWIPWLRDALISRGVSALTPLMSEPWEPKYDAFKRAFDTLPVSHDTVLVGHSCGSAFLVRWLGDTKRRVGALILVAPWKIARKNNPVRSAFYEYPIDPGIASRVERIVYFTSDNEEENGKKSLQIFYDALGGTIVNLKGRGHYTFGQMGTAEFPELFEEVMKRSLQKKHSLP